MLTFEAMQVKLWSLILHYFIAPHPIKSVMRTISERYFVGTLFYDIAGTQICHAFLFG